MFKLKDRDKVSICPFWCRNYSYHDEDPPILLKPERKPNDSGEDNVANDNDELNEDERESIINMRSIIMYHARPENCIPSLYAHLFLDFEQKQVVEKFDTTREKNEYIFENVFMNISKYSKVNKLRKILTDCKPKELSEWLPDRDKINDESRNEACANFLEENERNKIQSMYASWNLNADPNFLVPELYTKKLLDQNQKEIIDSKATRCDKNKYIHDNVLMVATYSEICIIREVLSKSKKHTHFTNKLPFRDTNNKRYNSEKYLPMPCQLEEPLREDILWQ